MRGDMSNPYAEIFYKDFKELLLPLHSYQKGAEVNPKVRQVVDYLNDFFKKAAPDKKLRLDVDNYQINMKKFADFVLSFRADMIAHAADVKNPEKEYGRAPEMLKLLENLQKFCVENSSKIKPDFDYEIYKLNRQTGHMEMLNRLPDENKKSMYFFGVNRTSYNNPQAADRAFFHPTKDLFTNEIFKNADVYFVSVPSYFPEEISAPLILNTIVKPEQTQSCDVTFAQTYWRNYIGKDLRFEGDRIVAGKPLKPDELKQNLQNLKAFTYCTGGANAHRCFKALKNLASQLYPQDMLDKLWKEINVTSFAFPLEAEKIDYKCTALLCTDSNPNNPEKVLLTNFPKLYNELKLNQGEKIKITNRADCKYVTCELPKQVMSQAENGRWEVKEVADHNGHRLQNVTAKNVCSQNFEVLKYILQCALQSKEVNDKKLKNIAEGINPIKSKSYQRA